MDALNNSKNPGIGVIVLAAGASRRMNEPKQLLRFEQKSLLRRAAENAVRSVCEPVIVVLGANFEAAKAEIEDLPLNIVFNPDWMNGLSFSIKAGLEGLLRVNPDISGLMITLADQPLVTHEHIDLFVTRFYQTGQTIIAARYDDTIGVPAFFSKEIFGEFAALAGDQGAKKLLKKRGADLQTITLPEAALDIDTPQDFSQLSRHSS